MAYILCYFVRLALDWGSSKTGGLFGHHYIKEDIEGPKTQERTNHLKPVPDEGADQSDASEVRSHSMCRCMLPTCFSCNLVHCPF